MKTSYSLTLSASDIKIIRKMLISHKSRVSDTLQTNYKEYRTLIKLIETCETMILCDNNSFLVILDSDEFGMIFEAYVSYHDEFDKSEYREYGKMNAAFLVIAKILDQSKII